MQFLQSIDITVSVFISVWLSHHNPLPLIIPKLVVLVDKLYVYGENFIYMCTFFVIYSKLVSEIIHE